VLGYGSNGTVVYAGFLDGRKIAIKRMLSTYYELAKKEVAIFLESDEHPNVVRYFAKVGNTSLLSDSHASNL
jgi:serine/threonine-protein kinase/endoribonuclease IRE1